MDQPVIALIAAFARNRTIGLGNQMPWHLPEDLRRFRRLTTGHRIIMGRKTFESIGRPLPGRHNTIVSRSRSFAAADCTVVHSLDEALAAPNPPGIASFVIGGGDIYRQALDRATQLFLTELDAEFAGDVFFPDVDARAWKETRREHRPAEAPPFIAFSFVDYERR